MLLAHLLKRMIHTGRLTVIDVAGRRHVFQGETEGPAVAVRLRDRSLHWKLLVDPMLHTGEAYTDGKLSVEEGDLYDFAALALMNIGWGQPDHWLPKLLNLARALGRRLAQYNPAHRARQNVAHHYDLTDELYALFLDSDRQYSCAYFRSPEDDLETAQLQKKQHLASKMLLQPGQRVLDIGSGWGGMGLHLAQNDLVEVTGVTLSEEQHKLSNERAAKAGLAGWVRFDLMDYRSVAGRFDRIVSVGMFEHVGVHHYGEFFAKLNELMDDDGIALIHSIGHMSPPGTASPWLRKYIFPGAYSPALSEVFEAVEQHSLWVTDLEFLRLHYAKTLAHWAERFEANRGKIEAMYDGRFARMWEFYLVSAEMMFRTGSQLVFQMQLARKRDAAPIVRDYIGERQQALRELEAEKEIPVP